MMNKEFRITGKHVLFGFIAFFGLIFVANGIFVYLALNSWTGLETREHYNEGLAYNRILDADARQKALGWQARIDVAPIGEGRARVVVSISDRNGQPMSGIQVNSDFVRPTHEGHDFSLALQPLGGGKYVGEFELPLAGLWDVKVAANRGGDRYLMKDRVDIR